MHIGGQQVWEEGESKGRRRELRAVEVEKKEYALNCKLIFVERKTRKGNENMPSTANLFFVS